MTSLISDLKKSESALLTKYVYTYKASVFKLLSLYVHRKIEMDIRLKTRTTKLNEELNINIELLCTYKWIKKIGVCVYI